MMIPPGTQVRLIDNPQRIGVVGTTRKDRNGVWYVTVVFADGKDPIREDRLEPIPEEPEDALAFLEMGRFSDAAALRRALTHVRLTGKLSDVIYSMEATNTEFYAYQFKPVIKILLSPVNGLLIADEVGLGKTIEAGLIWTELRSRFDYSRLVVLCPAALREKWREELTRRFGVPAEIVSAGQLEESLRDERYRRRGFARIASIQGLRPPTHWREDQTIDSDSARLARFLDERGSAEQLIDFLVIDEAHHLRNANSRSYELGELLRATSAYTVLLTATPIHNKNDDLHSLLSLLDTSIFYHRTEFNEILEANGPLVRAREHVLGPKASRQRALEYVNEALGHRLLKNNRQLEVIRHALTASSGPLDERTRSHLATQFETANLLGHIVNRTRKRDVHERRVVRAPHAEFVAMTDEESDLYERVTEAVYDYCADLDINEKFVGVMPQRFVASCMPAALRSWRARAELDEADGDSLSWRGEEAKASKVLGPLIADLTSRVAVDLDLDALIRNDTKYRRLKRELTEHWKSHPDSKVIIFSSFRPTLAYLQERLAGDGVRASVLQGGGRRPKSEVIADFKDDPGIRVLLSSEVGGEGVDLQFCWVVINYDLPWNPMKVEQRIGRVDRLGQTSERVLIWNLFYDDTVDARIYRRLYEKLRLCEVVLGDFEALLGEEFQQLGVDLLTNKLTPAEQDARIEQTRVAIENRRRHEEQLEEQAHTLVAYGDYVVDRVNAARELQRWITPQDLQVYTREFLNLFGAGYELRGVDGSDQYTLSLPAALRHELGAFIQRERTAFPTRLPGALEVNVVFENHVIESHRHGAEVISQFHPLIRYAATRMEQEIEQVRPAVAIDLSGMAEPPVERGVYVVASARWSARGVQTIERLVHVASPLDSTEVLSEEHTERLIHACIVSGDHWFDAAGSLDLPSVHRQAATALQHLERQWEEFRQEIDARNEDRADVAERSLRHHLDQQRVAHGERMAKFDAMGNKGLLKAERAKLAKIEATIERRLEAIHAQRRTDHHNREVLVGVVRV